MVERPASGGGRLRFGESHDGVRRNGVDHSDRGRRERFGARHRAAGRCRARHRRHHRGRCRSRWLSRVGGRQLEWVTAGRDQRDSEAHQDRARKSYHSAGAGSQQLHRGRAEPGDAYYRRWRHDRGGIRRRLCPHPAHGIRVGVLRRHLRDERQRCGRRAADLQYDIRGVRSPGVVARRNEDRVPQRPRWELRDLRHELRRLRRHAADQQRGVRRAAGMVA